MSDKLEEQQDMFWDRMDLAQKIKYGRQILDEGIEQTDPEHTVAMFSGGHDSLVATHLAMEHGFDRVLHIDTGIGAPASTQYVKSVCEQFGWPLDIVSPSDFRGDDYYSDDNTAGTYVEICLEHGMPGYGTSHGMTYTFLKQRPKRKFKRDLKQLNDGNQLYATGVRQRESEKRQTNVEKLQKGSGIDYTAAPIMHFTALDCNNYMAKYDLPRNEMKDLLEISGECFCGAYGKKLTEREAMKQWCPEVDEHIREIEWNCSRRGLHDEWATRVPPEKQNLDEEYEDEIPDQTRLMCRGCDRRGDMMDERTGDCDTDTTTDA